MERSRESVSMQPAWWEKAGVLLPAWGLAGVLLIALAGVEPQHRTQEARVLETAREMLNGDWSGWLIPHCNGRARLEKPPLAYWLVAGSFSAFGVETWAGRLPVAVCGWLMLAVTYLLGRHVLNARAALLASGAMLGSFHFLRFGVLAETDVLAATFVTVAVWGIWRGADELHWRRAAAWYQLSGVGIGLAILAKGPPALFVIFFLLGFVLVTRRWRILRDWVLSGAVLTAAVIAAPWFGYVRFSRGWGVLGHEVGRIVGGSGHIGPWWEYLPELLKATAPWSGFMVLAAGAAATHWRGNVALRGILMWALAVLVPLSCVPQKQEHYLLPILPPLMLLVGWMLDRAMQGEDLPLARAVKYVLWATMAVGLMAAAGPVVAGWITRRSVQPVDVTAGVLILTVLAVPVLRCWKKGLLSGLPEVVASGAIAMATVLAWAPSLDSHGYPDLARMLQSRFGDRPYGFYRSEDLSLVFAMRRVIPLYASPGDLATAVRQQPDMAVIVEEPSAKKSRIMPQRLVELARYETHRKLLAVYSVAGESSRRFPASEGTSGGN